MYGQWGYCSPGCPVSPEGIADFVIENRIKEKNI